MAIGVTVKAPLSFSPCVARRQTADGTYRKYSSLIQMPKGALVVAPGTNVFVSDDEAGEVVRIKGVALKFDKGQLHSRLWV